MKYMMDTNICIYVIKNKSESVIREILSQNPEDLCTSVATYAELVHGVERSQAVEEDRIAMSLFLSAITVSDLDGEAAGAYGQIRAELERKGAPVDPINPLAAGHARSQGLIPVTNNIREFARVTGLRIEDWTQFPGNSSLISVYRLT